MNDLTHDITMSDAALTRMDAAKTADGRIIRRAIREDARDVLGMVHALAVHHGDQSTVTLEGLEQMCFSRGALAQVWIASRRGVALGYAAVVPTLQLQFARRSLDLHHLYVIPAERGSGTGKALLTAIIAEAQRQGCAELTVGVMPGNSGAQAMYAASGFVPRRASAHKLGLTLDSAADLSLVDGTP